MLRSVIARFAKTSLAVTSTEINQIYGVVECLKDLLIDKARIFFKRHRHEPVLIAAQGDGTWQKSKVRTTYGSGDLSVQRSGGTGHDIYLQRCFFRSQTETMLLIDEPKSMANGKSSWHCFSAYKSWCSFLREARSCHTHVFMRFFCYDRLQFTSLMDIHTSDHRLESHEIALADSTKNENLLVLTEWTLGRACGDHDCQNSLKWALDPLHPVSPTETYEHIHIIVASVRNGFDIICRELPDWLVNIVRFSQEPFDGYELWAALGVEPKWIDELCELQLRWSEGFLKIKGDLEADTRWVERVSTVLMYLWNLKDFTATRWLTLGGTSKALARSLASGIDDIIGKALAKPTTSKYYLGGFSRLNKDLRFFIIALSLCSYPADAFMLESLEDDRVALRADIMRNAVHEELEYLRNVNDETLQRLADIAQSSVGPLRHAVLSSALRSCAFMDWRIFTDADSLPWTLCRGDIAQNLQDLKRQCQPPTDIVSRKLSEWA